MLAAAVGVHTLEHYDELLSKSIQIALNWLEDNCSDSASGMHYKVGFIPPHNFALSK